MNCASPLAQIGRKQIMLINNTEYKEALQEALECIKSAQYSAVQAALDLFPGRRLHPGRLPEPEILN